MEGELMCSKSREGNAWEWPGLFDYHITSAVIINRDAGLPLWPPMVLASTNSLLKWHTCFLRANSVKMGIGRSIKVRQQKVKSKCTAIIWHKEKASCHLVGGFLLAVLHCDCHNVGKQQSTLSLCNALRNILIKMYCIDLQSLHTTSSAII